MRRQNLNAMVRRLTTWPTRPRRDQIWGLSPSQLKTFLKLAGFHVPRDFYKNCTASRGSRLYRFRWPAVGEFFVDESCQLSDFDRWANSTDYVYTFANFREKFCG